MRGQAPHHIWDHGVHVEHEIHISEFLLQNPPAIRIGDGLAEDGYDIQVINVTALEHPVQKVVDDGSVPIDVFGRRSEKNVVHPPEQTRLPSTMKRIFLSLIELSAAEQLPQVMTLPDLSAGEVRQRCDATGVQDHVAVRS